MSYPYYFLCLLFYFRHYYLQMGNLLSIKNLTTIYSDSRLLWEIPWFQTGYRQMPSYCYLYLFGHVPYLVFTSLMKGLKFTIVDISESLYRILYQKIQEIEGQCLFSREPQNLVCMIVDRMQENEDSWWLTSLISIPMNFFIKSDDTLSEWQAIRLVVFKDYFFVYLLCFNIIGISANSLSGLVYNVLPCFQLLLSLIIVDSFIRWTGFDGEQIASLNFLWVFIDVLTILYGFDGLAIIRLQSFLKFLLGLQFYPFYLRVLLREFSPSKSLVLVNCS